MKSHSRYHLTQHKPFTFWQSRNDSAVYARTTAAPNAPGTHFVSMLGNDARLRYGQNDAEIAALVPLDRG